ncbi:hypothetical protein EUX98_g6149 [Antrodiella citrinella]|uniref:Uncharacterized protein n=1 Tax=Antrodiella citrinella TaxID=2447956 RepID=A0A4S4MSC8_9APHY|nr:hypothetical protein EUX98_g6149 [Antrodiella citrinella]
MQGRVLELEKQNQDLRQKVENLMSDAEKMNEELDELMLRSSDENDEIYAKCDEYYRELRAVQEVKTAMELEIVRLRKSNTQLQLLTSSPERIDAQVQTSFQTAVENLDMTTGTHDSQQTLSAHQEANQGRSQSAADPPIISVPVAPNPHVSLITTLEEHGSQDIPPENDSSETQVEVDQSTTIATAVVDDLPTPETEGTPSSPLGSGSSDPQDDADHDCLPPSIPMTAVKHKWFVTAVSYLQVDLGKHYTALIVQWIELEGVYDYSRTRTAMSTKCQPLELKAWYAKNTEPDIQRITLEEFASRFWRWWNSLQPIWRKENRDRTVRVDSKLGWTILEKHGRQGWYGLMVYIKWWGLKLQDLGAIDGADGHRDKWRAAIVDLSEMMGGLLLALSK